MLDFGEYVRLGSKTAIYPSLMMVSGNLRNEFAWGYPLLGVAGEASEVLEVLQRIVHNGLLTEELRQDLVNEMGDLFYYVAAYSRENGFDLGEVAQLGLDEKLERPTDIRQFQSAVYRKTDMEETPFEFDMMRAGVSLFDRQRIGGLMEEAKRVIRDDKLASNPERELRIRTAIGKTLVTMTIICIGLGLNMDDVAQANVEKLRSRMERGQISGSGNYR